METNTNGALTDCGAGFGYGMTVLHECVHCRFTEREGDSLMCRWNPKLRRYANQSCERWEREPGIEGKRCPELPHSWGIRGEGIIWLEQRYAKRKHARAAMTAPTPATIADEVYQELIGHLIGLRRYIDDESIALRRLSLRIDQLTKVEAARGWAARAMYSTMFGRKADAMSAAKNALRLSNEPRLWASVATNVYLNLAEFGEALNCLVHAAHPHRGEFSKNVGWLVMAGGIRTAFEYSSIAKGMGIEMPELPISLPAAIRALDEFDSPSLRDFDLAEMLTVAAEVLVDRGMFTSDQRNTLMQYDDGAVAYRFPLEASAQEVADVMMEMSDRLAKHRTLSVAFGVSVYPFAGAVKEAPVAA